LRKAPLLLLAPLVLTAACLLQTWFGYSLSGRMGHGWGLDDAYITYRYSEHLASGHGLVFNPGERVEGYSNLLYVLLIAPAFLLTGGLSIYWVSVALNLLLALAALVVFQRFLERSHGPRLAAAGAVVLSLCPPLWVAVASGMETPLVLLVQVGIWIAVTTLAENPGGRRTVGLGLLLVVSLLARADGFLIGMMAIVYLLLRGRAKVALWAGCLLLAAAVPYFLWRHGYYGYFLPNTYYAKVSGPLLDRFSRGFSQLIEIALGGGFLPWILVAATQAALAARDGVRAGRVSWERLPFGAFLAAGWLAYWFYIGGDHLGDRMLLILAPVGLSGLLALLRLRTGAAARPAVMGFAVLVVALFQLAPLWTDPRFAYTRTKHDHWITLGAFLRIHHPGETLAIDACGKVPYLSGLKTIDMLGLNDEYLAHKSTWFFSAGHNKYDADYILRRGPDLIAAWINRETLDLFYGLRRTKYESAGYRLTYLVNCKKDLGDGSIVNVQGWSMEAIRDLIKQGSYYAVLTREVGEDAGGISSSAGCRPTSGTASTPCHRPSSTPHRA